MALGFIDGFDHYNTNANGAIKWDTFNASLTLQTTTARINGNALKATNANQLFSKTWPSNQASWIIGFAFQTSVNNSTIVIADFKDSATVQCSLRINTDGTLQVLRGTATALNASGTSSFALHANTWYYIEWKVTIADSIGANTCKVNVNGITVINVDSGQDLKAGSNAFANIVEFINNTSNAVNLYYDDLYICDGTGSFNTDFLGDSAIIKLAPDGAGNYSQWTPDTGTNYTRVNESSNPDDDTSYVETSTANNIDTYTFGNLPSNASSVFGLQNNMWARQTDSNRQITGLIRISSTDYANANNLTLASSYDHKFQIEEVDPSTATLWTVSGVNGAEYGIKLIQ